MKRSTLRALCVSAFVCLALSAHAQSAAIHGPTISYQAQILDKDGKPLNDAACPAHVELLSSDGTSIWTDDFTVAVTDGVINLTLGAHAPLPPATTMDRAVSIGVSIRGNPPIVSALSAVPYALNVPDSSITAAKLGTDYVSAVTIDGMRVTTRGSALNLSAGDGLELSYDKTNDRLRIATSRPMTPVDPTRPWSEAGNTGTSPGSDYVGTADNQNLEIHVDESGGSTEGRRRVYLFTPNPVSANLVGGHNSNSAGTNVVGATIAGGGMNQNPNIVIDSFGTVGGGYANQAGYRGTVGGGDSNHALEDYATVGGGVGNRTGIYSTVGGGLNDTAGGTNRRKEPAFDFIAYTSSDKGGIVVDGIITAGSNNALEFMHYVAFARNNRTCLLICSRRRRFADNNPAVRYDAEAKHIDLVNSQVTIKAIRHTESLRKRLSGNLAISR